jgi:hypothetical protein
MSPFLTRCLMVALPALATACATEYTYVPRPGIEEPMGNRPAAEYAIPPEAPRGELQVASYGIVHVASQAAPDEYLHALHLRVIVRNDSDQPWTLDTREQRVELDGRGQSAPAFASANPGEPPPLVTIPPSGRRVVDLFFPLPADLQEASELPAFDAIWRVEIGPQAVVERTPFERLQSEPTDYEAYDYGYDYYWGPPYWYNPLYPEFTFFGPIWVAPELRGPPVTIRHERGHRFAPRGGTPPHEGGGAPHGGGGPHGDGSSHGGGGPRR